MQQQPHRTQLPLWFLVANWLLILAAFGMGVWLGGNRHGGLPETQREALEIVYQQVLTSHIQPPEGEELLERAIAGMVDNLDEYSHYYPPAAVPRYDEASTGNYEGIGAKVAEHDGQVIVHFPFPNGPADRAGLRPGDRILAVDSQKLAGEGAVAWSVQLVRGTAGSPVQLTVARGDDQLEITVERGSVQRPCVKWIDYVDREAGLGYVHLTGFHPTAYPQLIAAIETLEKDANNGELRGLILDLRYNRGGSLDQCLDIARTFVADGIIATQQRPETDDEVYAAEPSKCRWPDLPMVVLVNELSASASEVLSGALQDHKRAAIVGVRTHGKGYVNTVYSWQGHDFKLKLTTGSYRTPSGRNIERNQASNLNAADAENGGILPDIEVALDKQQKLQTSTLLERVLEVPDRFEAGYREVAARFGFEVEAGPTETPDPQLKAAIKALRERIQ
ncbi:MAG: S41 family peptidase [Planctomycetota bacterium]